MDQESVFSGYACAFDTQIEPHGSCFFSVPLGHNSYALHVIPKINRNHFPYGSLWLVCLMDTECVLCEVGTESLYRVCQEESAIHWEKDN